MRNSTLSIHDLKELAKKLPDNVSEHGSPYYKVAIPGGPMSRYHDCYSDYRYARDIPSIKTIEFRAERTYLDGAKVIGWYYHDLLVKVSV